MLFLAKYVVLSQNVYFHEHRKIRVERRRVLQGQFKLTNEVTLEIRLVMLRNNVQAKSVEFFVRFTFAFFNFSQAGG